MTQPIMPDFPTHRLKPADGISINARIWEEAHDYHRLRQQWHQRLTSTGILHGLEVVESKPPDTAVWILPGFAIDSLGRPIVLTTPRLCEIGTTRGWIHICLTASESELLASDQNATPSRLPDDEDQVIARYWQEDVNIVAGAAQPEGAHYVELARIMRGDPVAIQDAPNPRRPGINEIDLRWRQTPKSLTLLHAGILHLGAQDSCAWDSLDALAQSAAFARLCQLCVSDDAGAAMPLDNVHLLYVRVRQQFEVDPSLASAMAAFLHRHGVLFAEADGEADDATTALDRFFDALGVTLVPAPQAHPLLTSPHRFGQLPAGTGAGDALRVAGDASIKAVASTLGMAERWRGVDARGAPASREAIRAAHEWGMNLLSYAMQLQASGEGAQP